VKRKAKITTIGAMVMVITVCIGSGCHIRGSRQIIEFLQEQIQNAGLDGKIELEACFCQGHCTEGVTVRFDGRLVTGVNRDNIGAIFAGQLKEAEHEIDYHQ
jgi:NADH:ubiquinone oxidoreductase subunit E